jgi:hypothetical protein
MLLFMPDQPTWIHRQPEILAWLESSEAPPFLDRGLLEGVFQLRRRQALRLMEKAGGYQTGRTYLIDREQLAQFLRGRDSAAVQQAAVRKVRLAGHIEQARSQVEARRLRIRIGPELQRPAARTAALPAGIEPVAPGRLEIRFAGAEDLLSKVAELAAFAVHEPVRFRDTFAVPEGNAAEAEP